MTRQRAGSGVFWLQTCFTLTVLGLVVRRAGTDNPFFTEESSIVCPGNHLNISCADDEFLVVEDAVYGRTDTVTCTQDGNDVMCPGESYQADIYDHCIGSSACFLANATDILAEPCVNTTSYLNVSYYCISPISVTSICDPLLARDNQTSGFISSPNYPLTGSGACNMTLIPPAGQFISLDLIHLDFGNSSGCGNQSLQIQSNSSFILQYCEGVRLDTHLESIEFTNVTMSYYDQGDQLLFIMHYSVYGCLEADIPMPPGAYVSSYTYGREVVFSCTAGYAGSGLVQCLNNTWVGDCICNEITCGLLPAIPNGQVLQNDVTVGANATYSCIAGFRLNADVTRICLANATWSGQEAECIKIVCAHPGVPVNGFAEPGVLADYPSGASVSYSCDHAYRLDGASVVTCQEDGSWDAGRPSCTAIDCGSPEGVSNAAVSFNSTRPGNDATYTCGPGSDAGVNFTITCALSGLWEGQLLACAVPSTTPEPVLTDETTHLYETTSHVIPSPSGILVSQPGLVPGVVILALIILAVIVGAILYFKCYKKKLSKSAAPPSEEGSLPDCYCDGPSKKRPYSNGSLKSLEGDTASTVHHKNFTQIDERSNKKHPVKHKSWNLNNNVSPRKTANGLKPVGICNPAYEPVTSSSDNRNGVNSQPALKAPGESGGRVDEAETTYM